MSALKRSAYGQWPLKPSKRWPGENALTCPFCRSQDIVLTTIPGGRGTGPMGRWRMGDSGGTSVAKCNGCGQLGVAGERNLPRRKRR